MFFKSVIISCILFFFVFHDELMIIFSNEEIIVQDSIELGHYLFFDKDLSYDHSISCSSCHHQEMAFSDGYKVSVNSKAESLTLNSPSLINVKDKIFFSWTDSSLHNLDKVLERSFHGINPVELGILNNEEEIIKQINEKYVLDINIFDSELITWKIIRRSLVEYVEQLVARNSPYDEYVKDKSTILFTDKMKAGEKIFWKHGCNKCHGGSDFNQSESGFNLAHFNNPNAKYDLSKGLFDHTNQAEDKYLFRIPSLRNLCYTGPYFHNGSARTLSEAIDFHTYWMTSSDVPEKVLPEKEKTLLIHYLYSLCETDLKSNPLFQDPFLN